MGEEVEGRTFHFLQIDQSVRAQDGYEYGWNTGSLVGVEAREGGRVMVRCFCCFLKSQRKPIKWFVG